MSGVGQISDSVASIGSSECRPYIVKLELIATVPNGVVQIQPK
jgi:hypothetical protein